MVDYLTNPDCLYNRIPVVHLFNAIQQAQAASAASLEENKKLRGSGKPTLPAPSPHEIGVNKSGRAKTKGKALTKDACKLIVLKHVTQVD